MVDNKIRSVDIRDGILMEDKRQFFECEECGAEFSVESDMPEDPQYCPYCGDVLIPFINISNIDEVLYNENSSGEGEG